MAEYKGFTPAYNKNAPTYQGMPQAIQFMPYLPQQREMIAEQLQKGFGGVSGVQQMFDAVGKANVEPINVMKLKEPISQTMQAFGLQFDGTPGGAKVIDGKTFNPSGYQQYGVATGTPYIDQMFGLKYMPGETIPASASNPVTPPPTTPAPTAPAPVNDPYPSWVPMNRDDAERLRAERQAWEKRNGTR